MTSLTPEQKQIIESRDQHILVVANAGCGKTFTLIEKIRHLIEEQNVQPNKILLTSFSKVANEELLEKLTDNFGSSIADEIFLGTLHSVCYKIIYECKDRLSLKSIDMVDENYLAITAFNLALEIGMDVSLKDVQDESYLYRKNLISKKESVSPQSSNMRTLFDDAQARVEANGKLLFDDLLLKVIYLLETFPDLRESCQNKFDHIIIDEAQDTSYAQWKIIELFLKPATHTCIVGDVKQNIYAFRGASYIYMNDFRSTVNSKVYSLSETFRFGQMFADLSNKVIDELTIDDIYKEKTKTNVACQNQPTFKIGLPLAQVAFIVDDIKAKIANGTAASSISIIYRYNSEAIPFIKPLIRSGIPFKVKAADFYDRAELKLVMRTYNLLNKSFTISDCALLFDQYPNYVGHETLSMLYRNYVAANTGVKSDPVAFLDYSINSHQRGIGSAKTDALKHMRDCLSKTKTYLESNKETFIKLHKIGELMDISSTKFIKGAKEDDTDDKVKECKGFLDVFQDLYDDSKDPDLSAWYNNALLNNSKTGSGSGKDVIQLKTVHGSKGQSLPIVYLLLNKIASPMFCKTDDDLLNELFVLYVSLTRAESEMQIFIQDKTKFPFQFLLPDTIEELEFSPVDDSILKQLKLNYLAQGYRFQNVLKPEAVIIRSTANAVQFKVGNDTFWTPLKCSAWHNGNLLIDDWVCSKNNLRKYTV